MSAQATVSPCDAARSTSEWYDHLREEVDFHCSFCEAVHEKIETLEAIVKRAYALTAESMVNCYDVAEIAKRWFGLWAFTSEIWAAAKFIQQSHQICGVDLMVFEEYKKAAARRFQLHCPSEHCLED